MVTILLNFGFFGVPDPDLTQIWWDLRSWDPDLTGFWVFGDFWHFSFLRGLNAKPIVSFFRDFCHFYHFWDFWNFRYFWEKSAQDCHQSQMILFRNVQVFWGIDKMTKCWEISRSWVAKSHRARYDFSRILMKSGILGPGFDRFSWNLSNLIRFQTQIWQNLS